jgi:hypothetical protein
VIRALVIATCVTCDQGAPAPELIDLARYADELVGELHDAPASEPFRGNAVIDQAIGD